MENENKVNLVDNPLFEKEKQKRFVLYLDIMGFKDRVAKVGVTELKRQLLQFQEKKR